MAFREDSTGTYTFPEGSTGSTVDLGARNTYRYVNAENVKSLSFREAVYTYFAGNWPPSWVAWCYIKADGTATKAQDASLTTGTYLRVNYGVNSQGYKGQDIYALSAGNYYIANHNGPFSKTTLTDSETFPYRLAGGTGGAYITIIATSL